MGNQNLSNNSELLGWELVARESDREVYANRITGEEIEAYSYLIMDKAEFESEKQAFNLRLNSEFLVASRLFLEQNQMSLCLSSFKGKVFYEAIPWRLSKIDQIPFPDILHVYSQCFIGFRELFEYVGYFDVTEDLVCVNKQGVVKVWLNPSLEKIRPDVSYGGLSMESEMVDRAIKIIDKNTNHSTLPINIRNQFLRSNPSTFDQALETLNQITLKTKVPIPSNLKSAEQLLTMPSQVFVDGYYHQTPQPQLLPAYQSAQPQQYLISTNISKRIPLARPPQPQPPQDQELTFVTTSITPSSTYGKVGFLPPRISASKHISNTHNTLNHYKMNNNTRLIAPNQTTRKGMSVDNTQSYTPSMIYESPPVTSKMIRQVLSHEIPGPSSFIASNAHQSHNKPQGSHQGNAHGSQAGAFQFKSSHHNIKPREITKTKQIQFNKQSVEDSSLKNQVFRSTPINNYSTTIHKHNNLIPPTRQFNSRPKPAQIQTNQIPLIQFKPSLDHPTPTPTPHYKPPNHFNILKQSRIKNRTLSVETIPNSNPKQPLLKTEFYKDKPMTHEFKPNSKVMQSIEAIKQTKTPTLQFHQHINPNQNQIYKEIVSRRSVTKTEPSNQSDRAHLVRFNIDTELRQSNTPVQYLVKTPTNLVHANVPNSNRRQNHPEKGNFFEREDLDKHFPLVPLQQSPEPKHFKPNAPLSNHKQISRFSNDKRHNINHHEAQTTSSFEDSNKGFRHSTNPHTVISFNSTQTPLNPSSMNNNPYMGASARKKSAQSDNPFNHSGSKFHSEGKRIESREYNQGQQPFQ